MLRSVMKSATVISFGALWGLFGQATARAEEKAADQIGKKVPRFTLPDPAGKDWSLSDLKGKKAVVVVFLSSECPMSNAYIPALTGLAKTYGPKGVAFVGVNANVDEHKDAAAYSKSYDIPFPVYLDAKHAAVTALKADVNPLAFVLDGDLALRYRGRIDDGYSRRLERNPSGVARHDLKEAIEAVLAEKPVATPVTTAFGCAIEPLKSADLVVNRDVSFTRDVMPILQNHCQSCHRPGQVAPFSLMTYQQARKWGSDIVKFTQERRMPPWKPVDAHGLFQNERGLTDMELAVLAKWVESGKPQGDPKDLPAPRKFTDGWTLGEPDLILSVPEEMTVGATGKDLFRVFVLPTGLTEDKHVSAIEVKPGNPRVVHHTLNFLDTLGRGRKLDEAEKAREKKPDEQDFGPGYTVQMGVGFFPPSGGLGGWAPGQVPRHLPDGVGYLLPKNADVVLQVHYHRTGKVEKDQTKIGLYFAKKPVTHQFQPSVISAFPTIPAGAANHRVHGQMWIDRDITLYTVMPHMHLLGKEIKATMTTPDGQTRDLISIKDWDYNWQETYFLKEPLKVPAGTKFEVTALYDNSEDNPRNPSHPPKWVMYGEQTTNEMCFVFLGATSDKPGRIRPHFTPPAKKSGASE